MIFENQALTISISGTASVAERSESLAMRMHPVNSIKIVRHRVKIQQTGGQHCKAEWEQGRPGNKEILADASLAPKGFTCEGARP